MEYARFRMAGIKWELISDVYQADLECRGTHDRLGRLIPNGRRIAGKPDLWHAVPEGKWSAARRIEATSLAEAKKKLRKLLYE